MDDDGYPDDEELKRVEEWPHTDLGGLMLYVRGMWRYGDLGYFMKWGRRYWLSTAGWSGNESIVSALMANTMFWSLCWHSSKVGGHYKFELPKAFASRTTEAERSLGRNDNAEAK